MTLEQVVNVFVDRGLDVSRAQIEKIESYLVLLKEWNERIHLVSKGDICCLEERHILPSFVFAEYVYQKWANDSLNVVDLGTGAGLPGIVLAILFSEKNFWLLDSSRKKTLFLRKVKNELDLPIVVVNERFEKWWSSESLQIDLITARAVASIQDLIGLTGDLLKEQNTSLVTMKSCDLREMVSEEVKRDFNLKIIKNDLWKYSDYMKKKCLVSLEFLHG